MQLAQDDARASESSERAFLSPGKAFALLLGVILLLGAAIFLLRPDRPAEPTTTSEPPAPTFELTDAEAIARFEQLEGLLIAAYHRRDASLLDSFLTSDSPLQNTIADEIRQLQDDRVLDESTFVTREIDVVANGDGSIVIRQLVAEDPLFVDEKSGRDVTNKDVLLVEEVEWTLRLDNAAWKIFNSKVIESRVRKK